MQTLQRILLVEDDPDIQAIAKLALEAVGGFTVEVCSSGQAALEQAPQMQPDLILLDVMMPGMDGPTTLHHLRQLDPMVNTPIIFMTAKVQNHEIEAYKAMGAIDVIAKPFDPMTLADTVKQIWTRYYD